MGFLEKNSGHKGFILENYDAVVSEFPEHKLHRILIQEKYREEHEDQFSELTNREVEIITYLARGFNNPQIAEELFISRNTVEQHRKNIKRKLDVKNLAQLFQYALAFDLV